jgi:hypothetical protein
MSADDINVAILIRYQGSQASATYEVDANGDILLKHGASGGEVADTTVNCGGAGGTVDVSNTSCDTVGEAVDAINASANWVAVPLDAVRADLIGTTAELLDEGPLNAQTSTGAQIKWDTSAKLSATVALTERRTMNFYANQGGTRYERPFEDARAILHKFNVNGAYTGACTVEVISVAMVRGLEIATTIWSQACAATTVDLVVSETPYGFIGRQGEKLLLRFGAATTFATARIKAYAMEWTYRAPIQ